MMGEKKKLVLIHAESASKKLSAIMGVGDTCYLLSKDYPLYLELKNSVLPGCKVLLLGSTLNEEIEKKRTQYISLFAELSKRYDSIEWWSSHIASHNSASIPLQLNTFQLICAKKILDEKYQNEVDNRLVFISDSSALLESIACLGAKSGFKIIQIGKIKSRLLFILRLAGKYHRRILSFIYRSLKNRKIASSVKDRIAHDRELGRDSILIRSWITKGTLNDKKSFSDRNFGEMPEYLKSKNKNIVLYPMFFNLDKSIKDIYLHLKALGYTILLQEHYLHLWDYFDAIITGIKQLNIPMKNIRMGDLDLTLLFREVQLNEAFTGLDVSLTYPMLGRIKATQQSFHKIFYPFENNLPEKALIMGCRKYFPESELVAYQHTVWYKNQLGMFLSNDGDPLHPIADKIISSGPKYLEIMAQAGFSKSALQNGPNLRFNAIHQKPQQLELKMNRPSILLPLTFDIDLAFDLIHKIKKVKEQIPYISVYIRRHPLLDTDKIDKFMGTINFVEYEYADEGSYLDWLGNVDMVASSGGSIAILETVASGVPLLRIVPEGNIFLDPLAWSDYPFAPMSSNSDIINAVNGILTTDILNDERFSLLQKQFKYEYFTKPDTNWMKIFEA
jgi:hypothetical protein